MIDLMKSEPFAEGGNRLCYIYPKKTYQCLKITKTQVPNLQERSKPWYKLWRCEKSFDDNNRDYQGYQQEAL